MSTATTVSIRALIRETLAESGETDPHACVDAVLAKIPEGDREAYLRDAIMGLISTVASTESRRSFHAAIAPITATRQMGPRVEIQVDPISLEEKRVSISPKRDLIRADWEQFLSTRMRGANGWVEWRSATVFDLRAAVERRGRRIEALGVEVEKYQAAADILARSGAATVGELAEGSLREVRELLSAA